MDTVNIRCGECRGLIGMQRKDLGQRVRCPLCKKIVQTRAPQEVAPNSTSATLSVPGQPNPPIHPSQLNPTPPTVPDRPLHPSEQERTQQIEPGQVSRVSEEERTQQMAPGEASHATVAGSTQELGLNRAPHPSELEQIHKVPDLQSPFEMPSMGESPSLDESIFGVPEDGSDDLFGGPRLRQPIDIPPVEALAPTGAHAVAPGLPPMELDSVQRESPTQPFADEPGPRPLSGSGTSLLQDHSESAASAVTEPEHAIMPERRASSAPSVARKSGPGFLVPLLLIVFIPYSICATALIVYLIIQMRTFQQDPTIHYLEKMIEENAKSKKEIKRVKFDTLLPSHLHVPLTGTLALGAIEVKPLKVVRSPDGDLILYLRLKNISGPSGGSGLKFNPLPREFAKYNPKKNDVKPYIYLEAGETRFFGGKVFYSRQEGGKEIPVDVPALAPGEEITAMLATLPEDRGLIQGVLDAPGTLVWRVQLRRGLERLNGEDWPITGVIGIDFTSGDIKH